VNLAAKGKHHLQWTNGTANFWRRLSVQANFSVAGRASICRLRHMHAWTTWVLGWSATLINHPSPTHLLGTIFQGQDHALESHGCGSLVPAPDDVCIQGRTICWVVGPRRFMWNASARPQRGGCRRLPAWHLACPNPGRRGHAMLPWCPCSPVERPRRGCGNTPLAARL